MNRNLQKSNNHQDSGVMVHHEASFSGPLPHPSVLKQYNDIVPGVAERIIKMAEEQFSHRTLLEKEVIKSDISRSKSGQLFGLIIAIAGLTVALITILNGYEIAGSVIGGATLVSLVSIFVYGTATRKKEREEKEENADE